MLMCRVLPHTAAGFLADRHPDMSVWRSFPHDERAAYWDHQSGRPALSASRIVAALSVVAGLDFAIELSSDFAAGSTVSDINPTAITREMRVSCAFSSLRVETILRKGIFLKIL